MKAYHSLIVLVYILATCYLLAAPYTKVEESFNMQAAHDLIYHSLNVSEYDHLKYPGVVPRTFIGPISVALPALPIKWGGLARDSKLYALVAVRFTLLLFSISSMALLICSHAMVFSDVDAVFACLVFLSQFHLLFYASRPLANIFALVLTNMASSCRLIRPQSSISTIILCFAAAIFRCELGIVILTTMLMDSAAHGGKLGTRIFHGVLAGITGALCSIVIDSYFWQRAVYPELEVFHFNVFLNKSSEWGVSPPHWYFSVALPKALLGSMPLAAMGLFIDRRLRRLALPMLLFVAIYSYLPHKELRFIFYVLPVLNLCAGSGLAFLWKGRKKSPSRMAALAAALVLLMASTVVTAVSLAASIHNYPGGEAMDAMHRIEDSQARARILKNDPANHRVHIDADAAMSGITRFLERPAPWTYSKEENHSSLTWADFSHLITSRKAIDGFTVLHLQRGFAGISRQKFGLKMEPRIYVHVRNNLT